MSRCWTLLLVLAACGASPPPTDAPRSGQRERAMENCPSAVPGAHTAVLDVDGGVELHITAPDAEGQADVRETALLHAQMGAPTGEHGMHTGDHGGPGRSGHCPILHDGTQVSVGTMDGGAKITVIAIDPARVDAIRAETRDRVFALEHTP